MKNEHTTTKEDHHWTSDEKLKWLGYGEWVEEPDETQIEYLGYEAGVVRILKQEPNVQEENYFGGHLCGYIRIPEDHPLYKNEEIKLDCHHGLTFNEFHEDHWIGFDCGHVGDCIPSMELLRRKYPHLKDPLPKGFETFALFTSVYRNVQFCIDECKKIIDQLINEMDKWEEIKQSNKKSTNS